jgi:CRISPR-associated protein Cas5t
LVKNNSIFFEKQKKGIPANGTRYKINKVYDNSTGKRIFSKIDVLYTSNYCIDDESKEVFFDKEGKYIVNFN